MERLHRVREQVCSLKREMCPLWFQIPNRMPATPQLSAGRGTTQRVQRRRQGDKSTHWVGVTSPVLPVSQGAVPCLEQGWCHYGYLRKQLTRLFPALSFAGCAQLPSDTLILEATDGPCLLPGSVVGTKQAHLSQGERKR